MYVINDCPQQLCQCHSLDKFNCVKMVDCFTQIKIKSYKEEGLAVPKGSNFLILRKQEEKDGPVYIARYDGIDGEIPVKELQDTKMPKWFKDYDRTKAENFLRRPQIKDGEFLIRPAVRGKDGDYSASIKFNQGFQHFKLSAGSYVLITNAMHRS